MNFLDKGLRQADNKIKRSLVYDLTRGCHAEPLANHGVRRSGTESPRTEQRPPRAGPPDRGGHRDPPSLPHHEQPLLEQRNRPRSVPGRHRRRKLSVRRDAELLSQGRVEISGENRGDRHAAERGVRFRVFDRPSGAPRAVLHRLHEDPAHLCDLVGGPGFRRSSSSSVWCMP